MSKILALAGSNNSKSINYELVNMTATLVDGMEVKVLDIRKWDIPVYSLDMDPDKTPGEITELMSLIEAYDGFIIASPEHNGGTPAFFKNILDWLSRRGKKVFADKPVFLMSTSPGAGGGATNLQYLINTLPYQGANIAASYSFPAFQDNAKDGKMTGEHLTKVTEGINALKAAIKG